MQTFMSPRLAEPPREVDVAILGAGAAGIAAARRLLADGLRNRGRLVGGCGSRAGPAPCTPGRCS
jgi:cation diffusion facilitator CzcD-associated flavoprotein CzcO